MQPRLLYLSRNASRKGPRRDVLLDGGANVSELLAGDFARDPLAGPRAGGEEGGGAHTLRAKECSAELVAGGFGPGRACRFVAIGYSVRSRRWRYTRWERWPVEARADGSTQRGGAAAAASSAARVWTAGEGAVLAEELYCYANCRNLSLAVGSTGPEEVNLLAPSSAARLSEGQRASVRVARHGLMKALVARGRAAARAHV